MKYEESKREDREEFYEQIKVGDVLTVSGIFKTTFPLRLSNTYKSSFEKNRILAYHIDKNGKTVFSNKLSKLYTLPDYYEQTTLNEVIGSYRRKRAIEGFSLLGLGLSMEGLAMASIIYGRNSDSPFLYALLGSAAASIGLPFLLTSIREFSTVKAAPLPTQSVELGLDFSITPQKTGIFLTAKF